MKVITAGDIRSKAVKVVYTTNGKGWAIKYDWYDVTQTVTHYMKDGKEVQTVEGKEMYGDYRGVQTSTNFLWEARWADAVLNNSYGGIAFFSTNPRTGQEQETKLSDGNVERVEIDLLVSALGSVKDMAEYEHTIKAAMDKINKAKGSDKADKIIDLIKQIYALREKSEQASPTPLTKEITDEVQAEYDRLHPSPTQPKRNENDPFIKILPARPSRVKKDTSIWVNAPYGKRDTIYKQPYYEKKPKQ
jgi:hypothetical protein